MQKTRQQILEYLRRHGEATVDDLSRELNDLTAVTVRHHLDVLRRQGLVAMPQVRHRNAPGRPKYVYTLTEKAAETFPKNFQTLTDHLIGEIKASLNPQQVSILFQGVATRMATEATSGYANGEIEDRLDRTVAYLTQHGYVAAWESHPQGFVLHTSNCPYQGLSEGQEHLCIMDMQLISQLLGVVPRRLVHMAEGDESCSYLIPDPKLLST